jgi:hypothetical protein
LGDLDDQVGERIAVHRLAAAHAFQHLGRLDAVEHRQGLVAGAGRKAEGDVLEHLDSTPPRPKATSLPNEPSVTAPTMTSWPPDSICCTCTPSIFASALYFLALVRIVS